MGASGHAFYPKPNRVGIGAPYHLLVSLPRRGLWPFCIDEAPCPKRVRLVPCLDMQFILGIDLSCQPCELTVSQVDGTQVEVLNRTVVPLPLFASQELLKTPGLVSGSAHSHDKAVGSDVAGGGSVDGAKEFLERHRETVVETVSSLRRAVMELPSIWTATSVILPQNDFLSLNLDLPFGDPRNLDRIIDLEVQDVVPFELESFFVQYSPLGAPPAGSTPFNAPTSGPQFDVHVGILPRVVVKNVLDLCKEAGLEPNVLTVPSSAIGAVYQLAKDFLSPNSAVVYNRGDEYCIAVYINGEVRVERSVYASQILSATAPDKRQENLQHIFTALKLILAAAERRYDEKVDKVYLLGRQVKGANTHQLFGRPLEGLMLSDVLKGSESSVGISALGAIFAQDETDRSPLSNFRSREFSFTPRVAEFIRALMGTRRTVLRAVAAVAVAALVVYLTRTYLISSYENELLARIRKVIPAFPDQPERVRENLMEATNKLSEELGAFGSRAKVTPADAFIEVVKNIPTNGDIAVTSIRVAGVRIQIAGNAAELSPIERFIKSFDARKDIFSKVEYTTTRTGNRFNLSVTITLAA